MVAESNGVSMLSNHEIPSRKLRVSGSHVRENGDVLEADFQYRRNNLTANSDGTISVHPETHKYTFRTQMKPKKTGLLLVGLGGNNGSTLYGSLIANRNKLSWRTKNGTQHANYLGSVTQSTTVHLGWDGHRQVHVAFNELLPMVDPNDLIVHGWDIHGFNMYEAMVNAKVFEPELQDQLRSEMEKVKPMPSIYYEDFIASNQKARATNIIKGGNKQEHLEHIRKDIRDFKQKHNLECVIVLWTASTERYVDVRDGLNTTANDMLNSIRNNESEVSPSNIFAVASILEGANYINGSPQNTLVPGIIELAQQHKVHIGGDDFKSGQTKIKSVLVDFLVNTGLRTESIVSYNHLGNNDGKNLSEQPQFRSKEISKSSVVDDMVEANHILYPTAKRPDHVIVIKYVPFVGDSKRAMDEYTSSIFMGGQQTIVLHNTCEDSLLAAPIILDLTLLTELASRIQYSTETSDGYESFHAVLSILSLLLKAPVVPQNTPVCNALMKQLGCVTKLLCACAGVAVDTDLQLEFFTKLPPAMVKA
ncbi:hypothetical protein AB6A40_006740 [Gnathostoma spinigerum]|uniref:Inositol-3-phosphate synthase n=1 Tax=Gnathostoma spinigerum TaxID=75299 RepID=A0ABD6EJV2_9BILA